VAGGVGVVGVALGTYFALSAKSKFNDAQGHCVSGSTGCDATATSGSKDAKKQADLATVAFAVGGVGLAGAAVLWLTAPTPSESASARVVPVVTSDRAGVSFAGRF
jgi:hypothetical protein